jgi:hypothetical protein
MIKELSPESVQSQNLPLTLDGSWLFRTHGALRSHEATLALRLRLDSIPTGGAAGLLDGDIERPGAPSLRVDSQARVIASLRDGASELATPPLSLNEWCWIMLTYSREQNRWTLQLVKPNGYTDNFPSASAAASCENGIDLDTITIGGPRLAACTAAFHGALDRVVVVPRAWTAQELERFAADDDTLKEDVLSWSLCATPSKGFVKRVNGDAQGLKGREMRKDSVCGDGGSRGADGALLYRADLAQPLPPKLITDTHLGELGLSDVTRGIISETPSWSWETALTCGNGEHGALVLGRPLDEVIVVNRAGLFLPLHPPIPPPNQVAILPELRSHLAAGRFQVAADRLLAASSADGYGGEKRWTDPFIPAGFLRLQHEDNGPCYDYLRGLDFLTAKATTTWSDRTGRYHREVFVSRADDVVVVRIKGPSGKVGVTLELAPHDARTQLAGPTTPDTVESVSSSASAGWIECAQTYSRQWPGSLRGCRTLGRVIVRGGRVNVINNTLQVSAADEVLVLIRTEINRDAAQAPSTREDLAAISPDFDSLLARHRTAHQTLFERVSLKLGGTTDDHRLPTEKLFPKSRVGAMNPALMEKIFYACRHLSLCSSGKCFPPTLQGIWSGTWEPSWSGDYTQNGNLQCAVDGHLTSNLPEAMEGFFAYLESQLPDYRENARRLYGARGILIPSRTSSHGLLNHFCQIWPMPFWTVGAAWNARYFHDYWLHTGDRDFLLRRCLPFLLEAAAFHEDFLQPGSDGRLHFSPSYSPENDSPSTGSQACTDATMDHAAVRELFTNLLDCCRAENLHRDRWDLWESILSRLPDYRINSEGAVAEWTDARLEDRYEHRHASHLYALYHGMPDDIAARPELVGAFAVAIEKRMIPRRQAAGGVMAFGMVQLGAAAASLRLREATSETIDWLTHGFWLPQSLVSTHNPRSVFNVDITGGLVRVVTLALVDSRPGWIEILPALPSFWKEGAIEGLLCRGAVTLERLAWKPGHATVALRSLKDQTLELRAAGLRSLRQGNATPVPANQGNVTVNLPAGITVTFELELSA